MTSVPCWPKSDLMNTAVIVCLITPVGLCCKYHLPLEFYFDKLLEFILVILRRTEEATQTNNRQTDKKLTSAERWFKTDDQISLFEGGGGIFEAQ